MTDHKALIAEARNRTSEWSNIRNAPSDLRLIAELADALEAATAESVRLLALLDGYTRDYPIQCNARAKAEAALQAVSAERAVVEAQALEQAAEAYQQPVMKVGTAPDMVRHWLRARAVEIREGRQ